MIRMRVIIAALLGSMAFPALLFAMEDTRRWEYQEQGFKVIDEKCLVCHNRKRIEEASQARKDMFKIQQEMVKRGAKLSEHEQEVMGVFWRQTPFKSSPPKK